MNKKVVVLIVLLECIFAVFLVSFFGKAIEDARAAKLCEDVYFVTAEGEKIPDEESIEYELTGANLSYQLYWRLEAKDATKKEVEFFTSKPDQVLVDSTGIVTFLVKTDVVITIRATDGSGKTDSITLIPKRGGGGSVDII